MDIVNNPGIVQILFRLKITPLIKQQKFPFVLFLMWK